MIPFKQAFWYISATCRKYWSMLQRDLVPSKALSCRFRMPNVGAPFRNSTTSGRKQWPHMTGACLMEIGLSSQIYMKAVVLLWTLLKQELRWKIKNTVFFPSAGLYDSASQKSSMFNYRVLSQIASVMINMEYFTTTAWGRQILGIA